MNHLIVLLHFPLSFSSTAAVMTFAGDDIR